MAIRSPWKRYWLFQLPGLAVVGVLAWVGAGLAGLPTWICLGAIAAWAVKDALMYPWLRAAFTASPPTGPESLIGEVGSVRQAVSPNCLVKVGPEYWTATSAQPLVAGQRVRVVGASGMTLHVEPAEAG